MGCTIPCVEARVSVAKVSKYASAESGDSLEMIERPTGGLSFVLVDGQRSGKSAKAISNVVARKAISLLAEGVRDGAAARAASDYLVTYRGGKVLATLNILSIDVQSQTMVITRNNPAPVLLVRQGEIQVIDEPVQAVGSRRGMRPSIREVPIELGLAVVMFTDGLSNAGDRTGQRLDVTASVEEMTRQGDPDPVVWADRLLDLALELDQGRPSDDISIVVAAICKGTADETRRLTVQMPL
jgi:serine phosphatase RsbU (regulator of sigma subunit)